MGKSSLRESQPSEGVGDISGRLLFLDFAGDGIEDL